MASGAYPRIFPAPAAGGRLVNPKKNRPAPPSWRVPTGANHTVMGAGRMGGEPLRSQSDGGFQSLLAQIPILAEPQ